MAAIVSIRTHRDLHNEFQLWLVKNLEYNTYIIDRISVTFENDDDALAFCLRFGMQAATQNPHLLNRKRVI